MGPSLSSDQQSVIAPVRATRPNVGRSPVTPQRMLGATMLPPVSLPMLKATSAAAVAAPGPALDPDAPSSMSHGFIVCPPNQMSLRARAPNDNFASSTAPASCRRCTTTESRAGIRSRKGSAPQVVLIPAVSRRSFTPNGMPCNGPRYLPRAISASTARACCNALLRTRVMTLRSWPSKRTMRSR